MILGEARRPDRFRKGESATEIEIHAFEMTLIKDFTKIESKSEIDIKSRIEKASQVSDTIRLLKQKYEKEYRKLGKKLILIYHIITPKPDKDTDGAEIKFLESVIESARKKDLKVIWEQIGS